MKVVWALPEIDDPKTGGEKVYVKLKERFFSKAEILNPDGIVFAPISSVLGVISANIKNFKILLSFDKNALIFQDLYHRRKFLLANIFLSLLFGKKIILFVNERYLFFGFLLRSRIMRKILNYLIFNSAHKIVVNSKSTADWVMSFGDFKHKLFVFYPILEDNLRKEETTKIKGKYVRNLLCVANIKKNKGQEYLIDAMEILNREEINLNCVGLIRDEAYFNCLLRKVEEKGLSGRVKFFNFLRGNELTNAFDNADIFVLPTLKEGFGMVLLEAMSFSLPVIASRVGGVPEIIDDGVDGLLISPASPKELAEAIKRLVEDKELREHLGNNAYNKSQQIFNCDKSFQDLCGWLNEDTSI
jgi:glycosyltransferase involved in cell wall biosynthesis